MSTIINGKELARKIKEQIKNDVVNLRTKNIVPKLAVISIGNDMASKIYLKNKSIACDEIGMGYEEFLFKENSTDEEIINCIKKLNRRDDIDGILLQTPVTKNQNLNKIVGTIATSKDVDGFNPVNRGKLVLNEETFIPCTPFGIIKILEEYNIPVEGKNVVILGRSNIVGKPLAQCMLNLNSTVTICNSKTEKIEEYTKNADILISAVGKEKLVTKEMVKSNSTIIDVGMNRNRQDKLVGDVDFEGVKGKVAYITPVPGGVGPTTIAMLLYNVVKACKKNREEKRNY